MESGFRFCVSCDFFCNANTGGAVFCFKMVVFADVFCYAPERSLIGKPGIITIDYDSENGNYGITLEIESGQEELLRDWTKTALLYFNNGINEKIAEEAAERALAGEKAAYDLFTISSRIGINMDGATVTPLRIIEIRNIINR